MRRELVKELADTICGIHRPHPVRVAFDGIPAAGKTTLADEMAEELESRGRKVIRGTIDGFHNPPEVRRRQGSLCPNGYYEDSFNFPAIKELLLDPLGPDGNGRYKIANFDFRTESPVNAPETEADPDAVLIFDGVFLQRPEVNDHWDFRVFVDISFEESVERSLNRDLSYFGAEQTVKEKHQKRYIPGQKRYFAEARPHISAHVVVHNEDPARPKVSWRSKEVPHGHVRFQEEQRQRHEVQMQEMRQQVRQEGQALQAEEE